MVGLPLVLRVLRRISHIVCFLCRFVFYDNTRKLRLIQLQLMSEEIPYKLSLLTSIRQHYDINACLKDNNEDHQNQACRGYDIDAYIHGYLHGYIHVWISDFSHPVDISMDIVLSHLLIKLNI